VFEASLIEDNVTRFVMARDFLGKGLYRTACYHVDGLLVDTGMVHARKPMLAALRDLPVDTVVNTHAHEDHIGNNAALQARGSVRILAHEKALPLIADPRRLSMKPYQHFLFGRPRPSSAEVIGDRVETEHFEFRVVPAPGHCVEHVALLEETRGWLVTGDSYVGGRDWAVRPDVDVWAMIDTYRCFLSLEPAVLFTGSGAVVRDPGRSLRDKISHLEETGDRVLTLKAGGLSPRRIARRLFRNDLRLRILTFNHFSALNLVRAFLAPGTARGERSFPG
jgi:glyoxylase-like metal-dependent hydrolase (beta-lactamase superfamily II)